MDENAMRNEETIIPPIKLSRQLMHCVVQIAPFHVLMGPASNEVRRNGGKNANHKAPQSEITEAVASNLPFLLRA